MNHHIDHRDEDHGFAAVGESLVVLRQSPVSSEPREGAFDDPSLGKHDEFPHFGSLHDLDRAAIPSRSPTHEPACIATIGEDDLQPPKTRAQLFDEKLAAIAVLNIGGMNDQRQDQAERVHDDVALAAMRLLAGVVAARPPFPAVLTVWLSMIPTLGVGFLPTRRRSCSRSAS